MTCQDDELGLLISVGQDLETVGDDCQELDVVPLQQGDHLWDSAGQADCVLRALLETIIKLRFNTLQLKQSLLKRQISLDYIRLTISFGDP